ncbi:MAG: NAD(P)-dependent oxidoreductase [bacterium]|nr:NAD(P)-dependent oxidoreductase [bacterium]
MKKVLVTGANGYIGSHATKELLDGGHQVVAVDINDSRIDKRADYRNIDIYDEELDLFNELGQPDVLIHFACKDVPVHNSTYHVESIYKNFMFIKKLIDSGLKQVITIGSMHDIGYWEGAISEDTPQNPQTFYGVSKNTLRKLLEIYISGKDVCYQHLRFFYTYGDDEQSSGSIFSKILQMEKEGKARFPFTDGKNKFDYIEIHELAKQIRLVIEQTEVQGIINCCSGKPIAIGEMVDNFIKMNNLKIRPDYGKFPSRPYDSPAVWGDDSKIKQIIELNNKN